MAERSRRSKVQQPAVKGDSLFFVEEGGTGGTARSGGRSSTKRRRRPPTDSTRASKKACSSKEDVVFDPSTIRVGDDVMVRAHQPGEPPYVARVVGLGSKGQIKLRWFYRPEDLGHGRQSWQGARELFFTDSTDWNHVNCVEYRCKVHSFEEYENLKSIRPSDWYFRYEYRPSSRQFVPEKVYVHCYCEKPINPDRDMVMCKHCHIWYHYECANFDPKEYEGRDFVCRYCCPETRDSG